MLIRLFKGMKDFIIEREHLIGYDEVNKLAIQTSENTKKIAENTKSNFLASTNIAYLHAFEAGLYIFAIAPTIGRWKLKSSDA